LHASMTKDVLALLQNKPIRVLNIWNIWWLIEQEA
jgi:hypothetical protein